MLVAFKNTKKGFTLIELLVVIAIIGILSSIVLASLTTAREKARDARRISDIGQIKLALELYFDAHQMYPSTTPSGYSGDDAAVQYLRAQNFLSTTPTPLPGGANATYVYRGIYPLSGSAEECDGSAPAGTVCTSYELGASLERSDNPVLLKDADQNIGAFYGAYADCATNSVSAEKCYDVSP